MTTEMIDKIRIGIRTTLGPINIWIQFERPVNSKGLSPKTVLEDAWRQIHAHEAELFVVPANPKKQLVISDEEALSEIWGIICPDCGSEDNDGIVDHVVKIQTELEHLRAEVKELRVVRDNRDLREAIAILRNLQSEVEGPGYWILDHADVHLVSQLKSPYWKE